MPFARPRPDQLAVFQGGPSRAGSSDEHPAPVLHLLICVPAVSAKLVRDVRNESGGRTEKQPTARGPEGCVENGAGDYV